MAENFCDFASWTGDIVEENAYGGCYELADGVDSGGCNIRWFDPISTTPDEGHYPTRLGPDGSWEVYFEDNPRVLHAWDSTGCMMPHMRVTRVVECRCSICGPADDRFEYPWPQGCPVTILPPGRYRISVPKQRVYNAEVGDKAVVSAMLEVVGEQYVQAISTITTSGSSCGSSKVTMNNCCG